MNISKRAKLWTAGIATAALAVGGGIAFASGANAASNCRTLSYPLCVNSVAGGQVVNNSLTGADIKTNSLGWTDLDGTTQKLIKAGGGTPGTPGKDGKDGAPGTDGKDGANGNDGVTKLEADAPYPSATQLADNEGNGANSTVKFVGDEGATLQRAWVQCAEGKSAIGGGFQRGDESVAAIKNLQIVTSAATQIEDGKEVYKPIDGDKAGSLKPNAWLVEGFNNGKEDLIVRPGVICAVVTN